MRLTFAKGELLQLTSASYVPGSEQLLAQYFQTAFPVAGSHGYQPLARFALTKRLTGTFEAQAFIGLYKWPSAASSDAFKRDGAWPDIEAARPGIFCELRNHTTVVDGEVTLDLDVERIYEFQFVWVSQAKAADYAEYERMVAGAAGEFGGRVVAAFAVDDYESLQPWPHQPDRIVMLEWPDATGREKGTTSDGYVAAQAHLHTGAANVDSFLTRLQPIDK